MNTVFPETPGQSGAFLIGWRRRPGSGVSADNIEEVYAVIFKQAFVVSANVDPALGTLESDPDGPGVFEGDQQANLLQNADFAEGGADWTQPANATVVFGDGSVELTSVSGAEDLSQTVPFGRQLRERTVGIVAKAAAANTPVAPQLRLQVGGTQVLSDAGLTIAPELMLGASDRMGAGVTNTSFSAHFPSLAVNNEPLTYSTLAVVCTEYENDMVPFKPEADIIVIADALPLPISVAVNGTPRFSQDLIAQQELTGLGWEEKVDTPREGEAGDVLNMTQPLADDFQNLWFNGYRRNRRQGGAVPYLRGSDEILLTRASGDDYGFRLPVAEPALTHKWFVGQGRDDPCLWRSRAVPMQMDTLVIEPDRNRAYAVWRACWAIDDPLGGLGPIAPDANREVTVTLEGTA